jgi:hypothetical protein
MTIQQYNVRNGLLYLDMLCPKDIALYMLQRKATFEMNERCIYKSMSIYLEVLKKDHI